MLELDFDAGIDGGDEISKYPILPAIEFYVYGT